MIKKMINYCQAVRCFNCGKEKIWTGDKEPKWFTKKIKSPYIIKVSDDIEFPKINGIFCTKECLNQYDE